MFYVSLVYYWIKISNDFSMVVSTNDVRLSWYLELQLQQFFWKKIDLTVSNQVYYNNLKYIVTKSYKSQMDLCFFSLGVFKTDLPIYKKNRKATFLTPFRIYCLKIVYKVKTIHDISEIVKKSRNF